jgi:hypothetical protein
LTPLAKSINLSIIPSTLKALETQVHRDNEYIDYPPHEWVIPRRDSCAIRIRDVVIVGAGMSGLSVALLLMRTRVLNTVAIDRNEADHERPWLNYARMDELHTPYGPKKHCVASYFLTIRDA